MALRLIRWASSGVSVMPSVTVVSSQPSLYLRSRRQLHADADRAADDDARDVTVIVSCWAHVRSPEYMLLI
jgi:hypothetical protein